MADDETSFTVEQTLAATPIAIFRAWTERFDTWFATPGAIRMKPLVDEPYWFDVVHNGQHYPHYGRFLSLDPGLLIEQTWVTGRFGTEGAETVVKVELSETETGTLMRLTHSGFFDAKSAKNHQDSWRRILAHFDEVLSRSH